MLPSGSVEPDPAGRIGRAGEGRSGPKDPDRWTRVAPVRALAGGAPLRVQREGMDIFLVMVDGAVHACDNTCAHQHFAELHSGVFDGCLVTCPRHGWTYDVRTGLSTTGEGRIRSYRVSIRGDDIYINLP